jgi:hypothetical protein
MDRVAVESSNVKSIGYDPAEKLLEVEFKGGGVYQFGPVPSEEHQALMVAKSKGGYIARHIKPRFKGMKLQPRGKSGE